MQFAGNTKTRFTNFTENEIASLGSIKTKFALLAKFSTFRNEQTQYMEHYFVQRDNEIFNRNNEETINTAFYRFVDEVKGQIEAWSQRESGWVLWRHTVMSHDHDMSRFVEGATCLCPKSCRQRKQ